MIALKPMSALFAPYWSQAIHNRPNRIIPNLIWANIWRYLPFLFVPWIDIPEIIVGIFGLYMALYRGVIPAWMETIKCNIPTLGRERLVSHGSTIDYCGAGLLPFILGMILDEYECSWCWLFPLTALLGLFSTILLYWIPTPSICGYVVPEVNDTMPLRERVVKPWIDSWRLIRKNIGFAHFQMGFMLAASGIMVMQPALPIFFVDTLNLSYTKMLFALAACKGIAFAITSPFWVGLFRNINIYHFCGLVTAITAIFPFLLLIAQYHIGFLYAAYLLYGIMQAGSELGWHMSGPVFAQKEESVVFSGTNVLMVGIRGCFAPALGAILYTIVGATGVMLLCSFLCLVATQHFFFGFRKSGKLVPIHDPC